MQYRGYQLYIHTAGNGKVAGFIRRESKQFTKLFAFFDSYSQAIKSLQREVDNYVLAMERKQLSRKGSLMK
jgi:hypothetical protein